MVRVRLHGYERMALLSAFYLAYPRLRVAPCTTRALGYGVIRRDTRRRYPGMDEREQYLGQICDSPHEETQHRWTRIESLASSIRHTQ